MATRLEGEAFNFWSHLVSWVAWIPLSLVLVIQAAGQPALMTAMGTYGAGVLFLFGASALYHHRKRKENETSIWRTLDHSAIFVMIAASYTPVIAVWFDAEWKLPFLALMWGLGIGGLLLKVLWPRAPRWISPVLYLAMGWVVAFVLPTLWVRMRPDAFWAMAVGGLLYTVGAVIYGMKRPNPLPGRIGFHGLFHLLITAAALAQFWMVEASLQAALGV